MIGRRGLDFCLAFPQGYVKPKPKSWGGLAFFNLILGGLGLLFAKKEADRAKDQQKALQAQAAQGEAKAQAEFRAGLRNQSNRSQGSNQSVGTFDTALKTLTGG